MALYDKASLVLIPSGTKAGKVYSQKPTSGDGDFDFTRSSYATRINSQGLIEKERSNLWLQSTALGTSPNLTISAANITGSQTGYDGSSNAWELESLSDGFYRRLYQSVTQTGVITFSIYAKSSNTDFLLIYNNQNGQRAWFDLSSGSLGVLNNAIDSSIENIGSGWYRCSVSILTSASSEFWICPANGNNIASCDLGNSIYIQDAQLEQGLVARDYIETTTSAVYEGITDNVPRLDYDGDCPSFLLEPQRQNLIIHSEYLEGLNQNTLNLSLSTNLSPEGKYNAYRAERVSGSQLGYSFAATSGETYTTSIYARSISGSGQINITDYQGSANIFNITSDWARYELSAEATQSTGRAYVRLPQVGDVVEFYGFQSEQGSYATSYIPTYGTSVTRNGDLCNNAGDSTIFNSDEGVLFVEINGFENDNVNRYISLCDGSSSNAIRIFYYSDGGTVFFRKNVNNVNVITSTTTVINKSESTKIAVRYNPTNFDIFSNGVKILTNLNSDTFPNNTLSTITFTDSNGSSSPFLGNVKSVLYFNRALTDTELAELTQV